MARSATILIEAQTSSAQQDLQQLEGGLEGVEVAAVDAGDGFERLSQNASDELADTRSEAARTEAAMDNLSAGASGTANSLGIELTQAAQDAQFGVAGVANQLPQLQAEFGRLQSETGSTRGALSALASSFAGPTGVLAAGTLLLQFMPQLMSAFESTGESAETASDKVDSLAEATGSVVDVTSSELEDLELSVGQVGDAISQTEDRIGTLESRISGLQDLQSDVDTARAGRVLSQLERVQELEAQGRIDTLPEAGRPGELLQALRKSELTVQDLRSALEQGEEQLINLLDKRLKASKEELNTERGAKESLEEQQEELRKQLRAQGRLKELGATRAEDAQDSADATEREAKAMNALAVSATQAAENRETVDRFFARGGRRGQLLPDPSQLGGGRFGRTPTVGGTMLQGGQQPAGQALQAAREAGIIEEFQEPQKILEQMKSDSDQVGSTLESAANAFSSGMSQAAISLAKGREEAEVLKKVLEQTVKTLTKILIRKGILAILNAATGGASGAAQSGSQAFSSAASSIGSARHGGKFPDPSMVDVHPPELAMVGGGTEIIGQKETKDILHTANNGMTDAVVRKLDEVARRVEQVEVRYDTFAARSELGSVESELERHGAKEYDRP